MSDPARILPVAVHVPQLGGSAIKLKRGEKLSSRTPFNAKKEQGSVPSRYLKRISAGISFNKDVVKERGPETLPYRSPFEESLFRADKLVQKRKPALINTLGRGSLKEAPFRRCVCDIRCRDEPIEEERPPYLPKPRRPPKSVVKKEKSNGSEEGRSREDKWDKYVLTKLSDSAVDFLIRKSGSEDKVALSKYIDNYRKEGRLALERASVSSREKKEEKVKEEKMADEEKDWGVDGKPLSFQKKWLAGKVVPGKQQVFGGSLIRLDDGDEYEKVLTVSFPENPKSYSQKAADLKSPLQLVKGHQRWKEFPVLVQDDREAFWQLPGPDGIYAGRRGLSGDSRPDFRRTLANQIVDEWHSRCNLKVKWTATTTEKLVADMTSINDYTRLTAVSACAYAKRLNLSSDSHCPLPDVLLKLVKNALKDSSDQVKLAAAVTLFTLDLPSSEGKEVLYEALLRGQASEKWIAVQCLGGAGFCDETIVIELLSRLNSSDPIQPFKASSLLQKLSQNSNLVHFLTAEQLNSNCWQVRMNGCHLVPTLHGQISKDLTYKLLDLMWNDWSSKVRQAACKALGKTGNGKLVHDELREKLMNGKESEKIDALKKIRGLGLMTGRMLPSFLACFQSDYASIKLQATKAAAELLIKDSQVVRCLMKLMDDGVWKLKAHAIQALGLIGIEHPGLVDKLLWSMRFEKHPAVRAEACHSLQLLHPQDSRIVSVLRDLLTVDSDPKVREEAAAALRALGEVPKADESMAIKVQEEVQKLGTRGRIMATILDREIKENLERNRQRFLKSSVKSKRWTQSTTRHASMLSWIQGDDDSDDDSELVRLRSRSRSYNDDVVLEDEGTVREGRRTMQSTSLSQYMDADAT